MIQGVSGPVPLLLYAVNENLYVVSGLSPVIVYISSSSPVPEIISISYMYTLPYFINMMYPVISPLQSMQGTLDYFKVMFVALVDALVKF